MATEKQANFVADLQMKVWAKEHKAPGKTRDEIVSIVLTWPHDGVQAKIGELQRALGAGSGGASAAQMRLGTQLQVELAMMNVLSTETGFNFREATGEQAKVEIARLIALKRGLETARRAEKAPVTDIETRRRA